MNRIFRLSFLVLVVLAACNSAMTDPQEIVDKAIEAAGGDKFLNTSIEFDFRDRHYIAQREGGIFTYERILSDSTGIVRDILNNDGLTREINGEEVRLADSMRTKYASSVNSVVYFALLPYGLNDAAVQKKFLGEKMINNKPYYKIMITFQQEGGGEDHTDVFHYWINTNSYKIDYLSYLYHTDEGGIRFREAINPRMVNGIFFQDYINYKSTDASISLDQIEEDFISGKLVELSRIELMNITVQ